MILPRSCVPPGREAVSRAEVILLAVAPLFAKAPSIKSDLANSFSEQPEREYVLINMRAKLNISSFSFNRTIFVEIRHLLIVQ